MLFLFFFFKQKTAYEIYQCDWSSDVCSSDLEISFLDRGFILLPGEEKRIMLKNKRHVPIEVNDIELFVLNNYLDN